MARFILLFVLGSVLLTVLSIVPTVDGFEGDIYTLPADEHAEFNRSFAANDELYYRFETGNDVPIDVYLMTDLDYELYKQGTSFEYKVNGTFRNASEGEAYLVIAETDHYYVVLDNTDIGGASPPTTGNGSVTFELNISYYTPGSGPGQTPASGGQSSTISRSDPYYYYPAYLIVLLLVLLVALMIHLLRSGDDYLDYQ